MVTLETVNQPALQLSAALWLKTSEKTDCSYGLCNATKQLFIFFPQ